MFSDQQEVDLGDALAESISQRITVISDDQLTAHLRNVGDRLVQHLPSTNLKFRFYLVELADVNAFSVAGGRVYISRKMVALTQNEDELAGVIAHEMGHIATHQTAIAMTRNLRDTLGVNQVGDRTDIFAKYHQYLEHAARNPEHGHNSEEQEQYVADQVALYAMARAGYAPQAYVDLWDRFQQTHGKTGNWFTDLFGVTKPSQKRLREMVKNMGDLPASCADAEPRAASIEFNKWRSLVIAYQSAGREQSLPGLVLQKKLELPLRPDISYFRYSPDGKYILVQDEGGIHVLTREPLAQIFYIPAEDAFDAAFTPDSKSIIFHTPSLRVEVWSVGDEKRTTAYEVTTPTQCLQTALSTDGLLLGCLDEELGLNLLDVRTSKAVFTKNHFYVVSPHNFAYFFFALSRWEEGEPLPFIRMQFSPDGRYFMAAFDSRVVYDLADRRESSFPGSIRDLMNEEFTFLGDDRILGINTSSPAKSQIVKFPSGERLDEIPLVRGIRLQGSAGGDYVLLRPLKEYAAGAMDLKLKKITVGVKNPALDIYNGTLVHEQENGEISLDLIATQKHISAFRLPEANLGSLKAVAASGDLKWLAVSGRSRGAVWNVDSNVRTLHVRGFHGAWFSEGKLYVDMPEFEKSKRQIGELIPATGGGANGYQIGDAHASQYGPYILVTKPKDNRSSLLRNTDLEVRDVRDGHVLWSRYFPHELPALSFSPGQITMLWSLSKPAGHDELQHFGDLKKQATDDDYLAEVVDLASDAGLSRTLIKTNKSSFRVEYVQVRGNWLVVSATGNQILTYSAVSGEEKASVFGTVPVCSPNGELLAMNGESGDLKLYTLGNSQPQQEYTFPDPVSFKQFSADSKRLLVLTASQNVYILDVTAATPLVSSAPSVVK